VKKKKGLSKVLNILRKGDTYIKKGDTLKEKVIKVKKNKKGN